MGSDKKYYEYFHFENSTATILIKVTKYLMTAVCKGTN